MRAPLLVFSLLVAEHMAATDEASVAMEAMMLVPADPNALPPGSSWLQRHSSLHRSTADARDRVSTGAGDASKWLGGLSPLSSQPDGTDNPTGAESLQLVSTDAGDSSEWVSPLDSQAGNAVSSLFGGMPIDNFDSGATDKSGYDSSASGGTADPLAGLDAIADAGMFADAGMWSQLGSQAGDVVSSTATPGGGPAHKSGDGSPMSGIAADVGRWSSLGSQVGNTVSSTAAPGGGPAHKSREGSSPSGTADPLAGLDEIADAGRWSQLGSQAGRAVSSTATPGGGEAHRSGDGRSAAGTAANPLAGLEVVADAVKSLRENAAVAQGRVLSEVTKMSAAAAKTLGEVQHVEALAKGAMGTITKMAKVAEDKGASMEHARSLSAGV